MKRMGDEALKSKNKKQKKAQEKEEQEELSHFNIKICVLCGEDKTPADLLIFCDTCNTPYHICCLDYNESIASTEKEDEAWLCPDCTVVWNQEKSLNIGEFSNSCKTVKISNDINGFHGAVIGNQSVDKFTVRIDSNERCVAGFIPLNEFQELLPTDDFSKLHHYSLSKSGTRLGVRDGKTEKGEFADQEIASFTAGDYITCIREGTNIRFLKNKIDLGIAWENVNDDDLFPFLMERSSTIQATIIDDYEYRRDI